MRIAVTGAHGFLGSHVVDVAREAGHEVAALVSPWGDPRRLAAHGADTGVTLARADVTDPDALEGVFGDCDAVVHAAARVADHGPWAAFHRVNVEGTANVAREAARAGAGRVVLVSSVAIWRYTGIRGDDPRRRPRDQHVLPYGRSKILAEDALGEFAPEPVIVRPALWPYGARDPNLARVVEALRRGRLPLVDDGRAHLQTVDARLLARVLIAACEHGEAPGRAYLVADDGAPTWREVFSEIAAMLDVPAPRWRFPGGPLEAVAPGVEALWRLFPGGGEPPLTRYRAGLTRRDVVFDAGAVAKELGVRPDRERGAALRAALAEDGG